MDHSMKPLFYIVAGSNELLSSVKTIYPQGWKLLSYDSDIHNQQEFV